MFSLIFNPLIIDLLNPHFYKTLDPIGCIFLHAKPATANLVKYSHPHLPGDLYT